MRETTTGAEPNVSVGFGPKTIEVSIFPNQAFRTAIMMPSPLVENINTAIGAYVHRTCRAASDKVTLVRVKAVFLGIVGDGGPLLRVFKCQPAYAKGFRITEPDSAIRSLGHRQNLTSFQSVFY